VKVARKCHEKFRSGDHKKCDEVEIGCGGGKTAFICFCGELMAILLVLFVFWPERD
jgi:hypothetical protein